ncbi:MAG: ABC transporter permease [Solirubrobacterales bacterium]
MSPLIVMFLITSITMLRERTTGTLERLMTMPLSKLDLLVGYGIAFALLAGLQAAVTTGFAYLVLDLTTAGSAFWVALLAIANGVLGMSLGLLVSAFARTEFQAVQFMPAFILPQDPALRAIGAARRDFGLARHPRRGAALHIRL